VIEGISTSKWSRGKKSFSTPSGKESDMGKRVVIIGAGAAGASVAAEAKRTDPLLSITMIEQRPQVSVAS
jgi:cation diffusion facilitator CzcD-associated flavoprotein CzcO